jgi:hypothetical protein
MQNVLNNIYIGLVINNKDPVKKGRVQVFIPHITNTLYTGWNETNKNIKFRTFDSDVFTPEITQRLIDTLPWAEVAAPFFGGGTGAPVKNGQPTPIPTSPGDYMVSQEQYDTPAGNIPQKNLNENGTVNVEKLDPKIKSDLVEFTRIFPSAVITSGAEGKPGDDIHGDGSPHYPQNDKTNGVGKAFDLRIRDVDDETQQKYVEFFATRGYQGIGYEKIDGVVGKKDHIHVQLPPLGGSRYGTFGPDGKSSSVSTTTPKWFQDFSKRMKDGDFISGESRKNPPVAQNGLNNPSATISSESNTVKSSKSKEEVSKILKDQRRGFVDELKDENTKKIFYSIIDAEVGSYPDIDKIMLIESVMNRTYARKSEGNTLRSRNYYGPNTQTKINKTIDGSLTLSRDKIEKYDKLVNDVINTGSNLSNFATGNNQNSPKDKTGYAGGPETAIGIQERFGLQGNSKERVTDINWAKALGVNVDDLTPYDPKQGTKVARPNHDLDGEKFDGVADIGNKGGAMGFLSVPHIGSKAYVMFLDGNHLRPIVIGAFKETSNG